MNKYPSLTLGRLELLHDGKCYLKTDDISIISQLYKDEIEITEIGVLSNTQRKMNFSDILSATFNPTTKGTSYGPTWSTHWFKIEISIPKEWKNQEIHFLWDSSSEATLWSSKGIILQVRLQLNKEIIIINQFKGF